MSLRKRYIKKQKALASNSKDDELDLLGDDKGSFTGSNADLESAADNLFTSPRIHNPYPLVHCLSKRQQRLSHPSQVLPGKLEKSLGDSLIIHLQQQMGSFQASMLEVFQSLREELTS